MKKLTILLCFFTTVLNAQGPVKRYVLLEHFTNSVCPVCKARNPGLYGLVDQYSADVHHIAYHPPVPYSSCIFYQHNPTENKDRADYYDVFGTPVVSANGAPAVGLQSFTTTVLQTYLGQTSPVLVQVSESANGSQRTAGISVVTVGTVPGGTYKLFAAIVEKRVDYNSPIGSNIHRNVFRKMLAGIDGATYEPASPGSSVNYSYTFDIDPAWVADSIYVVAFIQNTADKNVLNSGTKFDPVIVSAGDVSAPQTVQIQPNPATAEAWVSLPGKEIHRLDVFSIGGQLARTSVETRQDLVQIPLDGLAPGLYVVKMTGKEGVYVGKLVKE